MGIWIGYPGGSTVRDLILVYKPNEARRFIEEVKGSRAIALYVIGSTLTSTIPGISIAGASPKATLYTPALDVEYLITGKPLSMGVIPVTPEGIPTPAIITRASLKLVDIPYLVVNTGSYIEPRIPHVALPSRCVGGLINECEGLPKGVANKLFRESESLGESISRGVDVIIIGESIPGGTLTALGILAGLGYEAWGLVSSSRPRNPHELKEKVVRKGLKVLSKGHVKSDIFGVIECLGDPVHVSIAGLVKGVVSNDARVILAGGTQMSAVLAILKSLNVKLRDRLVIGTTKWIIRDNTSNIVKLVSMTYGIPIIAFNFDFSRSRYEGLKYYERGYVKEGVGAGGTAIAASIINGVSAEDIIREVHEEYSRLLSMGG
ncbi:MAG TPA: TIGR00303 family protein [Acidilobales archaeon]|nr:TIGR00303 family protein [Acidilobales archaeon]